VGLLALIKPPTESSEVIWLRILAHGRGALPGSQPEVNIPRTVSVPLDVEDGR